MTKEDIIRMARVAGWHDELLSVSFTQPLLERFAELVAEAERESVIKFYDKSYQQISDAINAAVQKEREACAKLCDKTENSLWDSWDKSADPSDQGGATTASHLAALIRQRGEQ